MTYLIDINEEQRLALLTLVKRECPVEGGHPLEYWVEMLDGIPQVEADNGSDVFGRKRPMIHGFCL